MKELDVMDNFLPLDQFSIIENSFKNLRFPWLFVPPKRMVVKDHN